MAALFSLTAFQLTFRVAEPAGLARRLPLLANGVTDQGLGEESAANEAGNPVLDDVGFYLYFRLDVLLTFHTNGAHQPPASCAQPRGGRVTTTSSLHRWSDTIGGKCTPPKDTTQARRYLERGAVAGRLHALVGRTPHAIAFGFVQELFSASAREDLPLA